MPAKNPLYGDPDKWDGLSLVDRLEYIRLHLCTGPGGSSMQAMTQRERIDRAIKQAEAILLDHVSATSKAQE